jgi:purine nucleoside phosphorylase
MTKSVLGIIGGSGIYDLPGLTNAQSKTVESPWGKPSAALLTGEIGGLPIVFCRAMTRAIGYRRPISITAPISMC